MNTTENSAFLIPYWTYWEKTVGPFKHLWGLKTKTIKKRLWKGKTSFIIELKFATIKGATLSNGSNHCIPMNTHAQLSIVFPCPGPRRAYVTTFFHWSVLSWLSCTLLFANLCLLPLLLSCCSFYYHRFSASYCHPCQGKNGSETFVENLWKTLKIEIKVNLSATHFLAEGFHKKKTS